MPPNFNESGNQTLKVANEHLKVEDRTILSLAAVKKNPGLQVCGMRITRGVDAHAWIATHAEKPVAK